jgi:ATP-dependent Zn protease
MPELQNKSNQSKKSNNQQPKRSRWSWLYYVVVIGLLFFFFNPFGGNGKTDKNLSYTKFTAYIENDAIASVVVYDDNTAKAKIRPEKYAIVFSNQEAGEDAKGELSMQIPTVEEFAKYIDSVNNTRKEQGKAAIDVSYAKSRAKGRASCREREWQYV